MPQMVEIPPPSEGRPIPPKFELRPLTTLSRADLQEATMMLAYAFDEHPLFRLAFPKAASRSKILQTLFTTVLKDAIRFGRVEVACSHKIVGMLIWYPPGCYPMSKSRILRLLPHYARLVAVSPVGLMKLFRAQTTLNGFRPMSGRLDAGAVSIMTARPLSVFHASARLPPRSLAAIAS